MERRNEQKEQEEKKRQRKGRKGRKRRRKSTKEGMRERLKRHCHLKGRVGSLESNKSGFHFKKGFPIQRWVPQVLQSS